jgi:hypothetical protein
MNVTRYNVKCDQKNSLHEMSQKYKEMSFHDTDSYEMFIDKMLCMPPYEILYNIIGMSIDEMLCDIMFL